MSGKQKLFYEIVAEVLPSGAKQNSSTRLQRESSTIAGETVVVVTNTTVNPPVDLRDLDNYDRLYKLKAKWQPPNPYVEVEAGVWWTPFGADCACCRTVRTSYVTFIPEMAHICSRKCYEKFNV